MEIKIDEIEANLIRDFYYFSQTLKD